MAYCKFLQQSLGGQNATGPLAASGRGMFYTSAMTQAGTCHVEFQALWHHVNGLPAPNAGEQNLSSSL